MARGLWVPALVVLVTTSCGAADEQTVRSEAAPLSQSPAPASSFPGKCCVPPAEPSLKTSAQPKSGAVGTTVRVLITGCGSADSSNFATVSFNNDALTL